MQPDATILLEKSGIQTPLIGVYDAPDPEAFSPVIIPKPTGRKNACVFAYYNQWMKGNTLHITADNFGCPGCGYWLFGKQARKREDFVKFLADDEGLKANHDLMNQWLDYNTPYKSEHGHIFIGPLKADLYDYVKTITFFVNPDQFSFLLLGANYHASPSDPPPVIAPFGSGCMELLPLFQDLDVPQAIFGVTDIAMRNFLPPDILALTVTKPMFQRLCSLDENSFLYKPFWQDLQKVREK